MKAVMRILSLFFIFSVFGSIWTSELSHTTPGFQPALAVAQEDGQTPLTKAWSNRQSPTGLSTAIDLAIDKDDNVTTSIGAVFDGAENSGYCYVGIENLTVKPDEEVTVPIILYNSPGVGCCGVRLRYDTETVLAIDATHGDFTSFFDFNDLYADDGWVTINTFILRTDLSGDPVVANITLKAVGDVGDSILLSLEILAVADQHGYNVPTDTDNGTFTIEPLLCEWDFDDDRDVDGSDLAIFAAGYGAGYDKGDLSAFAREFGKTNCLE